ncbi:hypothetical protein NAPIS_ORF02397 [Vairimorpha apis BRL 01]|uniref:Uncharacterized protein n=1 Tax=Vairimorpha apis BRL 01 TaxID=1037528 RepID=T0L5V6_9MICR|nr:hypothetical protein NAPIS_ORF02397 [Vairimorpha apis BRL 01]
MKHNQINQTPNNQIPTNIQHNNRTPTNNSHNNQTPNNILPNNIPHNNTPHTNIKHKNNLPTIKFKPVNTNIHRIEFPITFSKYVPISNTRTEYKHSIEVKQYLKIQIDHTSIKTEKDGRVYEICIGQLFREFMRNPQVVLGNLKFILDGF